MGNRKSRVVAMILAITLGAFGGQFFYLGKKKAGWLSLIFFWTFIPAILAVKDFWVWMAKGDEYFDQKYNQ